MRATLNLKKENEMAGYHTDQKERLLDYLGQNKTRQLKMEEIVAALDGRVGKSTVYRLMQRIYGFD